MLKRIRFVLLGSLLVSLLHACAHSTSSQTEAVYQALGGEEGIADVVAEMLYRVADDSRINDLFRGVDVSALHGHLTAQLCELAGGPCRYEGRTMRESHAGMDVGETEFNALVEHLILALEAAEVPVWAQNRLLAKLAPMHQDIVD